MNQIPACNIQIYFKTKNIDFPQPSHVQNAVFLSLACIPCLAAFFLHRPKIPPTHRSMYSTPPTDFCTTKRHSQPAPLTALENHVLFAATPNTVACVCVRVCVMQPIHHLESFDASARLVRISWRRTVRCRSPPPVFRRKLPPLHGDDQLHQGCKLCVSAWIRRTAGQRWSRLAGLFSMTKISKHTRLTGVASLPGKAGICCAALQLHVPLFPLRRFASCSHHPLRSLPFVMVRSPFTIRVVYRTSTVESEGVCALYEAQQTKQI